MKRGRRRWIHRRGPRPQQIQGIWGGTQENVVFARDIQHLEIHEHGGNSVGRGGLLWRSAAVLGALALLFLRPELPLPDRWDPGPVQAGWLLLVGAVAVDVAVRIRDAAQRRRLRAWRSPKHLARALEALADGLFLRYDRDERLAQISDPRPIEVTWTTPADAMGERAGETAGETAGEAAGERVGESAGESVGVGPPVSLADYFTALPTRRLVVLGGAGAGKSVLVLRLAHDLLRRRTDGSPEPVPAVVSLASWDPRRQGLMGWVARQLADEYPEACEPVPGAPPAGVALELILDRRVLLVLDGFDELPPENRKLALEQITGTLRGGVPFVLTSREPEYREHAPDAAVFERTEITLSPLTAGTTRAYLSPGTARTRWSPVLARLADEEERAPEVRRLRQVLSVPLTVALARVAYADPTTDPAELLAPGRFRRRADLERHLYDAYLDVVYSTSHDIRAAHGGWDPVRARAWAGFLAARGKAEQRQDIAWWRLDEGLPRAVRLLGLLPAYAVSTAVVALLGFGQPAWRDWLPVPLWGGFLLLCGLRLAVDGLVGMDDWPEPPRRPTRPTGAEIRAVLRRRRVRAVVAVTVLTLGWGWTAAYLSGSGFWRWVTGLLTAYTVWRCALPAVKSVVRPSDPALARSPAALLRADRRAVLTLGWLRPVRASVEDTPAALVLLPPLLLLGWGSVGGQDVAGAREWALACAGAVLSGALYGYGVSAWGRFTVARAYLALTGRLPWRLMAFLEDAHTRGVLRQSGAAYRFRHIELRDRLAQDAPASPVRSGPRPAWLPAAVALPVTGAALVVFLGIGAQVFVGSPGPVRSVPPACRLLTDADLGTLMTDPATVSRERGRSCSAGEQSPFARNTQIELRAWVETTDGVNDGPAKARFAFGQQKAYAEAGDSRVRTVTGVTGLGDAAFLVTRSRPAVLDHPAEQGYAASWTASVGVRAGNAVVVLTYGEEFASRERVAEVAEVLARTAVRRAELGPAPAADRRLSAIPRPALPSSEDTRFGVYSHRPAQSLTGAAWRADERSYLWHLTDVPFVFRAPKHLKCGAADEDEAEVASYICRSRPENVRAGPLPDLRLSIRSYYCGESCSQKETDDFLRASPDHATTPWKKADDSTYYATETHGDDRYRMSLKRHWGWSVKSRTYAFLLWARVDGPESAEEWAQKPVNDMFTQTGGR
ncbi:NACHT domain-containing protein [Streptomyces sp. NPDC058001]|uniref:NACHT domain-containing protein n=1 Tax=Streptomyces sp. NPDC058001 TaxID=3346300 RepID=UPI0036E7C37C